MEIKKIMELHFYFFSENYSNIKLKLEYILDFDFGKNKPSFLSSSLQPQ